MASLCPGGNKFIKHVAETKMWREYLSKTESL
jgi:hypothetical protein